MDYYYEDVKKYLEKMILDQAPVWEEKFPSGTGIVCSVKDAAAVVAKWYTEAGQT